MESKKHLAPKACKPKSPLNLNSPLSHLISLNRLPKTFSNRISLSNRRRTCLCLVIFSLLLSLYISVFLLFSLYNRKQHFAVLGFSDRCSSGRVYVYDLPEVFNKKLIEKCEDIDPWKSLCDAVSNNGLGRPATGLDGVVPENLEPAWYWTEQYSGELIFHNRVMNHPCRTLEPESASAFYIPFYARFAVEKYLWPNSSIADGDRVCEMMLRWVQEQPHWKRSYGWDHFIMIGRMTWDFRRIRDDGWGSRFLYMPAMENVTRLLVERHPLDQFDIGVPYPTGFHPRSDNDVIQWQDYVRSSTRKNLFCFVGATRSKFKNDFRRVLFNHCKNESDVCKLVDCAGSWCYHGASKILQTFLESDFCLQPRGDSHTRRSVFDCMLAGSIPVIFWKRTAYDQYEWFLPAEPASYSVYIDHNRVKNGTSIRGVLERFSKEEIREMRENVIDQIPKLVYAARSEGLEYIRDAVDVALDGVLERFKKHEDRVNRETRGKRLFFSKKNDSRKIEAFTNADRVRSASDKRSTIRSKKQVVVARSSAEIELLALAQEICELLSLKIIMDEFSLQSENPMLLYCNNKSAINIAHNIIHYDCTKHIKVDRHFTK
ncbi:Exostosin, GT47 domain [Dillenia turbinata]|uniref:Exostosin, GT47 domain n=1 Tax=Dillenia turbinata TaxID=194707 RepID=A0AAN8V7F8_9MAGN